MNKAKRRGKRRMIHASISTSKKFNGLSCDQARLLYLMIYPHTDDLGHVEADAVSIKTYACPGLDWTTEQIGQWIEELNSIGLLKLYKDSAGELFAEVVNFDQFQSFAREREPQYPEPKEFITNQRPNSCINENNQPKLKGRELKGREEKGTEEKSGVLPPSAVFLEKLIVLNYRSPQRERMLSDLHAMPRLHNYRTDVDGQPEAVCFCLENIDSIRDRYPDFKIYAFIQKAVNEGYNIRSLAGAMNTIVKLENAPHDLAPYWVSLLNNVLVQEKNWELNIWPKIKAGGWKYK